jgi:CheY-like chemotaxis protein
MISVLYVDDEEGLLELGKRFLEISGQFRVDTVTSAHAALQILKSTSYEAIVSDYQMPAMDGIAFLKAIRAEFPEGRDMTLDTCFSNTSIQS